METSVWILTCEHNAYDQFGEYFVKVWKDKPAKAELFQAIINYQYCDRVPSDEYLQHILAGGGRLKFEETWYHLREVKL